MTKKKYWAFISYSSKDNSTGSWLHKRLENYPIPSDFRGQVMFDGAVLGKNLRPVFRDRDELSGSSSLGEAIREALESSRFLIVLCSKNSAKSVWVNKEIETFISMGKGSNILALILDGEPNATSKGRLENECFPPALQYPAEPIAGDLRKEGDGKERGFLKVLAGITQLDFDLLYRRHERNMTRRRRTIALLSGFLILTFAGLAGYAFYQQGLAVVARTDAIEARDEAKAAQILAEKNEKLAKDNEQIALIAKNEAEKARDDATVAQQLAEDNEKLAKANEAKALINQREAEKQRNIAEAREKEVNYKLGEIFFKSACNDLRTGNFEDAARNLLSATELGLGSNEVQGAAAFLLSNSKGILWDSGNLGKEILDIRSDPYSGLITIVLGDGTVQRWDIINKKINLEYQFIDKNKSFNNLDSQVRNGMLSPNGKYVTTEDLVISSLGNYTIRNLDDPDQLPIVPILYDKPLENGFASLDSTDLPVIISEKDGGLIGLLNSNTGEVISSITDERIKQFGYSYGSKVVSGHNWTLLGYNTSVLNKAYIIQWTEQPEMLELGDCRWVGRVGNNPAWVDDKDNLHIKNILDAPLQPPKFGSESSLLFVDMDSNKSGTIGAIAYKPLSGIGGQVVVISDEGKKEIPIGFPPEKIKIQENGQWIAVSGINRIAVISYGKIRSIWNAHQESIKFIEEGPDGSLLTVGTDGRIRLWDTDRTNNITPYPLVHDYYEKVYSNDNLPLFFSPEKGKLISATYDFNRYVLTIRSWENKLLTTYQTYELPQSYTHWGYTDKGEIVLSDYYKNSIIFVPGKEGYKTYNEDFEYTKILPTTSLNIEQLSNNYLTNSNGIEIFATEDYQLKIIESNNFEKFINLNPYRNNQTGDTTISFSRYDKSSRYGSVLYTGITDLAWDKYLDLIWIILKESNGAEYLGSIDIKHGNLLYFQRLWNKADAYFISNEKGEVEALVSKEEFIQFIPQSSIDWNYINYLTNITNESIKPIKIINPWESGNQLADLFNNNTIPMNLGDIAAKALKLDPTSVDAKLALAWSEMLKGNPASDDLVPKLPSSHPLYSKCQIIGEMFSLILKKNSNKWIEDLNSSEDDKYTRKLKTFVTILKVPNQLSILLQEAIDSGDYDIKWFLQEIQNNNNPQKTLYELYEATFK